MYVLLSFLLITSCSTEETPFVENEQSPNLESIIKADLQESDNTPITTDYLKNKWEKQLAEEGTPYKLGNFQIVTSTTADDEKTFFLKAVSVDGTFETGAFLIKDQSSKDGTYRLGEKTCSCKGCASGCSLQVDGNKCSCSSCPYGSDCVKTETVVIGNQ